MLQTLIVIPARYASVRFPGKPLALIQDKPMVQWVYENAIKTGFQAVVATDDERIYNTVLSFGGKAVMTSPDHPSGTDRCLEAMLAFSKQEQQQFDIVVNVQGDEPFVQPEQIRSLAESFSDPKIDIATLISEVDEKEPFETIFDANKVKVVTAINGNALYFSRSTIPYNRNVSHNDWIGAHPYYIHIGMYAYRTQVLEEITQLPPSKLEMVEKLEQLRWLENGYTIKTTVSDYHAIGVDTPEDLEKVNQIAKKL